MIQLSQLQQDALNEILNIGISNAAASLSEIANEEVELSIPHTSFFSAEKAAEQLNKEDSDAFNAVRQSFSGLAEGQALLIFPENRSLEVVRKLVGEDLPLETLTDLEEEALTEVGNILLNACLSSLADVLGETICSGLPTLYAGNASDILILDDNERKITLFLKVDMRLKTSDLKGYVVLLLDVDASVQLIGHINQFIEGL